MQNAKEQAELLAMFVYESESLLHALEALLVEAERRRGFSGEAVREVFRIVHTLKGSAAMMGYPALSTTAHQLENLFSFLRDNEAPLEDADQQAVVDAAFAGCNYFRDEISGLSTSREEPQLCDSLSQRVVALDLALRNRRQSPAAFAPAAADDAPPPLPPLAGGYQVRVFFKDTPAPGARALVLKKALAKHCDQLASQPAHPEKHPELGDSLRTQGLLVQFTLKAGSGMEDVCALLDKQFYLDRWKPLPQLPQEKRQVPREEAALAPGMVAPSGSVGVKKMVSVDQENLARHIELLGELVTVHAMVEEYVDALNLEDSNLDAMLTQARKFIARLHRSAIAMNLVEVDTVFFRMRLIVREMAAKLGKAVDLVCEGGSVALDKGVIEHLNDPLMHVVRNALDHAIEPPHERRAAGKPERGVVTLWAQMQGDDAILTIADDGRGIDRDKVLATAQAKGMLTKPQARYTDKEVYSLLAKPGFSTKQQVSEYSGRGVGLDVANAGLHRIGGSLQLDSVRGQGTTITMRIPSTLSIMDVLEVVVGEQHLVFPVTSLRQIVSENIQEVRRATDDAQRQTVVVDEVPYPVLDLAHRLHLQRPSPHARPLYLLARRLEGDYLIRIDAVLQIRTVVLKPLSDYLKSIKGREPAYVGCAILGNGQISMVLDVNRLWELSGDSRAQPRTEE